jgi:antitoxin component of MazEF toxin-antitoxin module
MMRLLGVITTLQLGDFDMLTMRRKLIRVGNSLAVTIPEAFVKQHNLDKQQEVILLINDSMIKIIPETVGDERAASSV